MMKLTLDLAAKIIDAAFAQGREIGCNPLSIAVLDAGGHMVAFMRQDRQLNTMISQVCRNEFAMKTMGLMHGLSRRFWYQHYREVLDLPLCSRLHAAVADAIARGDESAAAAASDALLDYIETFTRATLDADGRAAGTG